MSICHSMKGLNPPERDTCEDRHDRMVIETMMTIRHDTMRGVRTRMNSQDDPEMYMYRWARGNIIFLYDLVKPLTWKVLAAVRKFCWGGRKSSTPTHAREMARAHGGGVHLTGYLEKLPAEKLNRRNSLRSLLEALGKEKAGEWEKRFFVVNGHLLEWYKDASREIPQKTMNIRAGTVKNAMRETKEAFSIAVSVDKEFVDDGQPHTVYLRAPNEDVYMEWFIALDRATRASDRATRASADGYDDRVLASGGSHRSLPRSDSSASMGSSAFSK
jgi:hypothetical protein